jgi:catechol 2,3-dioxygenase-like lactoylglutathione lyase family enzyme
MDTSYDRAAEDVGNIVALEHVNVTVPDPQLATVFYVSALGLTRDPYLMTGPRNMWVNVGRSQFHLPTNKPQVLRGITGLVIPDRAALLKRLNKAKKNLDGTAFDFHEDETFVEAVCPWGNRIRCHEPAPRFGPVSLGMPYVEFEVAPGTAEGIARFYTEIMGTRAAVREDQMGRVTQVVAGVGQQLLFRETSRPLPDYDGHHIAIYIADFSGPYQRLLQRGLIFEESNRWQYRFKELVDPRDGRPLFTIEHEVRSMTSPMFMRPLVNRDPNQNIMHYQPGHDAWTWGMAHEE